MQPFIRTILTCALLVTLSVVALRGAFGATPSPATLPADGYRQVTIRIQALIVKHAVNSIASATQGAGASKQEYFLLFKVLGAAKPDISAAIGAGNGAGKVEPAPPAIYTTTGGVKIRVVGPRGLISGFSDPISGWSGDVTGMSWDQVDANWGAPSP